MGFLVLVLWGNKLPIYPKLIVLKQNQYCACQVCSPLVHALLVSLFSVWQNFNIVLLSGGISYTLSLLHFHTHVFCKSLITHWWHNCILCYKQFSIVAIKLAGVMQWFCIFLFQILEKWQEIHTDSVTENLWSNSLMTVNSMKIDRNLHECLVQCCMLWAQTSTPDV